MTMHTNIKKILIVEDDFQLATEWQKELIDKGYSCDIVTNSDDARLLFHKNYECFIIDLFHVQNDTFLSNGGIRSIGQIRKRDASHNKKSLIITVTGYYRDSDNHKISTGAITESLGADYTLKKPIEFSNILKLIEDW